MVGCVRRSWIVCVVSCHSSSQVYSLLILILCGRGSQKKKNSKLYSVENGETEVTNITEEEQIATTDHDHAF